MKILQKKYHACLILMSLFFTITINAHNEYSDYEELLREYHNRVRYENSITQPSTPDLINSIAENSLASINVAQIGFGMGIGIICTLAWNYYARGTDEQDADCDGDSNTLDKISSSEKQDRKSPLPFNKRVELLDRSLHGMEKINLNIPLIASLTQGYSRIKLEKFLKILKRSVTEYNINFMFIKNTDIPLEKVYPLDMSHVQLALEEVMCGSTTLQELDTKDRLNTAIHEAGHAVSVVGKDKFILRSVSIINRVKSLGRIIRSYRENDTWTMNDYQDDLIVSLCGGIAEQVFGFDKSWYAGYGSSDRQNFSECCSLAKNKNISKGLAELLAMPSAVSDMVSARQNALYIVKRYLKLQNKHEANGEIENQVCCLLEECYQKALLLVQSRKTEIEKIAQLLMKHDIISGDAVYAVFGAKRPLYAFEMKS